MKQLLTFILLFPLTFTAQISETLKTEMNKNEQEFYRIRIEFNDNVDCFAYNQLFKSEKYSLERRQKTIIRLLQEQANTSQTELVRNLKTNSPDMFRNLQQFWIINILVLEAKPDLIHELATHTDIAWITLENNRFLPALPVEQGVNVNTKSVGGTEPGLIAINAPAMWALGYTGRGRLVYDYDTGVWPEHPAFTDRFMANFFPMSQSWLGFFRDKPNGNVSDHGTHTLGTMAGLDTATKDTIGVAFKSYWIANDFVTSTVAGLPPITDMIGAFEWALNPDGDTSTTHDIPDVINNSWRWYDGADTIHCEGYIVNLMNAIEAAGLANVFAGGNFGPDNTTVNSPQRINTSEVNTFSVGSINANAPQPFPISSFSSRGPTQCGGTGSLLIHPEVVAPGQNVRSAWGSNEYNSISGTSMATPHVSGALLLLKEAFPYLTGEDLLWAIYLTAIDMGDPGEDNTYGNGLIDVYAAFQYLSATYTPVDPTKIDWDIAIQKANIPSVDKMACASDFAPEVTIINLGDSTYTSLEFSYYFDTSNVQTYSWSGNLTPGNSETFNLPMINTSAVGEVELTIIASSSKDSLEYDLYNNRRMIRFTRRNLSSLPFTENFENGIDQLKWYNDNPDHSYGWDTISAKGLEWSTTSATIQFYDYSPRSSQIDNLITPELDLPISGTTNISFDLSYEKRSSSSSLWDTLKVVISTDCGVTFPYEVYSKAGADLYTNDTTHPNATPTYEHDWKRETIDISAYNGSNVMVAFRGVNRQGNNLYLDNINIYQGQDLTGVPTSREFDFMVFPNPTKDVININIPSQLGSGLNLTVYDAMGKRISSTKIGSGNYTLPVSHYPDGIYAIVLEKGSYKSVKRFVKE